MTLPDYISPSQAGMFARCQAQWKYRYVDGIKSPPSAALAFGKAFDETANSVYSEKMVTGDTAESGEVADRFAAQWDAASATIEDWEDEDRGALLDKGVALAGLWRNDIAVNVKPVGVQVPANVEADGVKVFGIIDTVAEEGGTKVVHELKTKAKSISDGDMARSLQVPIYAHAAGTDRVQWDVCVKTKIPKTQTVPVTVTPEDVRGALNQLVLSKRLIDASVRSGDFLPNRQQMMCSRRWCAYWSRCEKDHGGTVPA